MQTEKQSSKPETELKEETGEGCSGATCSALSDAETQELVRLAWTAGFHAETPTQKAGIEKALMLAVSEGWSAESEDDVDYAYASITITVDAPAFAGPESVPSVYPHLDPQGFPIPFPN